MWKWSYKKTAQGKEKWHGQVFLYVQKFYIQLFTSKDPTWKSCVLHELGQIWKIRPILKRTVAKHWSPIRLNKSFPFPYPLGHKYPLWKYNLLKTVQKSRNTGYRALLLYASLGDKLFEKDLVSLVTGHHSMYGLLWLVSICSLTASTLSCDAAPEPLEELLELRDLPLCLSSSEVLERLKKIKKGRRKGENRKYDYYKRKKKKKTTPLIKIVGLVTGMKKNKITTTAACPCLLPIAVLGRASRW